jgi:hypothetical protein
VPKAGPATSSAFSLNVFVDQFDFIDLLELADYVSAKLILLYLSSFSFPFY